MISSFEQAEQFIESRNSLGIKLGLQRIKSLLKFVHNPHLNLKAIHVAGTNGKGSTIYLLEKALLLSNYSVGVFTSPSFTGIRGHMTINQVEISEAEFVIWLNKLIPFIKKLDEANNGPTSFEIVTVIAFLYFQQNANIVLIETGMGGKDDTTNVIEPLLSIITNVEKDHTQFLGDSYEEIATHKAGIIKRNCPVVIGKVNDISKHVINEKANLEKAPTYFKENSFDIELVEDKYIWSFDEVNYTFTGEDLPSFQLDNIANVMMALTLLENRNYEINWLEFLQQLSSFSLQGRFELISHHPFILLDSAHNVSAMKCLIYAITKQYPTKKKHIIFSTFKDKDVKTMVKLLRENFNSIILTTFSHERAVIKNDITVYKSNQIEIHSNWQERVDNIMKKKKDKDLYIITGSLHFIIQVRQYILQKIEH